MPAETNPLTSFSHELATLASRTAKSVVAVVGDRRFPASGFIWRPGLVVTAEAALERDDDLAVVASDGGTIAAKLVGRDPSTAVALLRVDNDTPPPLAAGAAPDLGALVVVAGRGRDGATAHFGTVSLSGPAWRSLRGGEIDARIRLDLVAGRGAEGGPVVDSVGRLCGMLVFGPRRRALVIPSATIERVACELLAKGRVARAYLGLGLRPIRLDRAGRRGLIVVSVDPDGPAQKVAMHIGDVVTTWNGEPVQGLRGLMRRLGSGAVGTSVKLGIVRAGAEIELSLEVAERPA